MVFSCTDSQRIADASNIVVNKMKIFAMIFFFLFSINVLKKKCLKRLLKLLLILLTKFIRDKKTAVIKYIYTVIMAVLLLKNV